MAVADDLMHYEFHELATDDLPCDGDCRGNGECDRPARWYGRAQVFGILGRILLCHECRTSDCDDASNWLKERLTDG